jgi:nitroreductase
MDLIELCKWRYATKKMDPSKAVPDDKLARILEAIRLAPTSSGLQPFEVMVITDPALRARIRAVAKDQSQVVDGSHLLLFAAWDTYTDQRINQVFDQAIIDRGVKLEGWENYRQMLLDKYPPRDAEENFQHAARQAYIALAFGLMAAANEGVDATPMEGFDPIALDELLGLRAKGLRSVLLMPLGYRDAENDWWLKLNKTRRPKDELFVEVK